MSLRQAIREFLGRDEEQVRYDETEAVLRMTLSVGGVDVDEAELVRDSLGEMNVTGFTVYGIRENGQPDAVTIVGKGSTSPDIDQDPEVDR